MSKEWTIHNPGGSQRVVVTKELPGSRWLDILVAADCAVEVCQSEDVLTVDEIKERFGDRVDGAIGQLTEDWNAELFAALAAAGGRAYSNYAVGYNNVDVAACARRDVIVTNTPGVLTDATADLAMALTLMVTRTRDLDSFVHGRLDDVRVVDYPQGFQLVFD